ncbi:MAG TPA: hypothetical protein VIN03_10985 [Roseateles sp.]
MSLRILPAPFAALALLLSLSPAAFAATYRCDVGGSVYITDKPCAAPAPAAPPPMGSIGPARTPASYQPRLPSMPEAPEHHRYLSPRCAELSDAIRTGPARGVNSATVSALRREYEEKCSEDDQYARRQVYESKRKERENVLATRTEAERSREEAERTREKCIALLDSLRNRRVENETERRNKRAAEDAYNASCLGK